MASQVRTEVAEIAQAVEASSPPAAADPVEVAAVAYLFRPAGWSALVGEAARAIDSERGVEVQQQTAEQVGRLRAQVDAAAAELKQARQRHREEIARLKAENAELRQKLGDARAKAKASEEAEERAQAEVADAQRAISAASAQG